MFISVGITALVIGWLISRTDADDWQKWLAWGGLTLAVVAAILRDTGHL